MCIDVPVQYGGNAKVPPKPQESRSHKSYQRQETWKKKQGTTNQEIQNERSKKRTKKLEKPLKATKSFIISPKKENRIP